MNHGNKQYKLNRRRGHREALFINLFKDLVEHKRIRTTITKAKALRPYAERLITKAKKFNLRVSGDKKGLDAGKLAGYRELLADVRNDEKIAKILFNDVVPTYAQRPGGYTRIVRCGMRADQTEKAFIEFTDYKG